MKILIYGAGFYGRKLLKELERIMLYEVIGFADHSKTGDYLGYPILDIDKIDPTTTTVIISIAGTRSVMEVFRELCEKHFTSVYWYLRKENPNNLDVLQHNSIDLKGVSENTLIYAEMHLVDYCNLNCRGCTHFSALFDKNTPDVKKRIKDVKRIAELFDKVLILNLMGGEPFLSPDLEEYIESIRSILPMSEIQITTNGLLIPQMKDQVFECIHRNRVTVSISEYEPTKRVIEKIRERLDSFQIDYCVRVNDLKSMFNKPLSTLRDSKHPKKCVSGGCVNIWEGRIACCPTLMFIEKFNEAFGLKLPKDGIYSLYDNWDAVSLNNLLLSRVPLCDHCVENEISWSQCKGEPVLEDFAIQE